MGPVVKDIQTGIQIGRIACRNIVYIIYRTVTGCIGIQVITKLHTYFLAEIHGTVAGKMLGTIETHMLQEMGQTTLVFFFLYRTHLLGNIEKGSILGIFIMLNILSQSVGQSSLRYIGVKRQFVDRPLGNKSLNTGCQIDSQK